MWVTYYSLIHARVHPVMNAVKGQQRFLWSTDLFPVEKAGAKEETFFDHLFPYIYLLGNKVGYPI